MAFYRTIDTKESSVLTLRNQKDIYGTRMQDIVDKPHLSPEYSDGDMGAMTYPSGVTNQPIKTFTFTAPENLTIKRLLFFPYSNYFISPLSQENPIITMLNSLLVRRIEVVSGTGPEVGTNLISGDSGGICANIFSIRSVEFFPELNLRINSGDVIEIDICYRNFLNTAFQSLFVNPILTYNRGIQDSIVGPSSILGVKIGLINSSSVYLPAGFILGTIVDETLPPIQLLAPSGDGNITGGIPEIEEDPSAPDADWITYNNLDIMFTFGASFPPSDPIDIRFGSVNGLLNDGVDLQRMRLWIRKSGASGNPPAYSVEILEFGESLIYIVPFETELGIIGSTIPGLLLELDWDASILQDKTGANMTVRFSTWRSVGGPGTRRVVELGAIAWDANYTTFNPISFTRAAATLTVDSAPASGPIHLAPTNFLSFLGLSGDINEKVKTLSSIPGGDADNYNSSIAVVQDLRDDILNVLSVTGSSDFDSFLEIEAAGTNQILFTSKNAGPSGNFELLSTNEAGFTITEFTGGTIDFLTVELAEPDANLKISGIYVYHSIPIGFTAISDPTMMSFHGIEISSITINTVPIDIGKFVISPMCGFVSFNSVDFIIQTTDTVEVTVKSGGGPLGESITILDIILVGVSA